MMNLCGMLSAASIRLTPDEQFERLKMSKLISSKIIGYLILSVRLLFSQSRSNKAYDDLVSKGHITQEEHSYFISLNVNPMYPLCLVNNLVQEAAHAGLLGPAYSDSVSLLLNDISNVRGGLSAVSLNIGTQLPYPFIQLVTAVCYAFLIQLVYVSSAYISTGLADSAGKGQANLATGYLTIILYSFVLFGLLHLFDVLSDPLGEDAADFPGDTFLDNFEKTLLSVRDLSLIHVSKGGLLERMLANAASTDGSPNRSQSVESDISDGGRGERDCFVVEPFPRVAEKATIQKDFPARHQTLSPLWMDASSSVADQLHIR